VRRRGRSRLLEVLRTPGLGTVLVANFAYMWFVIAVFDTLVPLFASDELGMSTIGIGIVFAVALAAEFAVLYPAGSLADRRGRRFVLVPSLAFLALATAAVGFASSPVLLGVAMAVLGVASGFAGVPPGAMLSDVVEKGSSATAVGVFRFCGDLGFTLGPLVAGFAAAQLDFRGAFPLAVAPTLVALVLALRSTETLRRPQAA